MKISELKVLICDDSILVRKQLSEILKMMGITAIFVAKDGIQAVEAYKEHHPDVAFMDIVMPKKTGVEALEEIKAYDTGAKVIMASTIGTQNYLLNAIKAGATDFLQKPVKDEDVYRVLHNIVKGMN